MKIYKEVASKALNYVKSGMILGIGSGPAVHCFIQELGLVVQKGLDIKVRASSLQTIQLVRSFNIPILYELSSIDLYVDGANYIDDQLDMIKGYEGSLFREKLLMLNASCVLLMIDDSNLTKDLSQFKTPIEILPYSRTYVEDCLRTLALNFELRKEKENIYLTDNQHYIIDVLGFTKDNYKQSIMKLKAICGVLEVGYFEQLADIVLVAHEKTVYEYRKIKNED